MIIAKWIIAALAFSAWAAVAAGGIIGTNAAGKKF